VTEGKIAGKLAFDVIDSVPSVEPKVKNGVILKNDQSTRGEIEFRDVEFKYPSR
jgi:ABC-type multidrug transport system fused ATPase/permease subunit